MIRVPSAIRCTALYGTARTLYRWVKPRRPDPVSQKNARYDAETVEVMRRTLRPTTVGVDVGAHQGTFLREMFTLAPGVRHIAVEPLPKMAARLQREFPDARVVEAAFSDRAGMAVFHHLVNSPTESGLRRVNSHGDVSVIEQVTVRVLRLDDVIASDETVSFIKIDTEGAELPVIRGAEATIRRCRPVIVFETGSRTTPYYGVSPEDIIETIHGFEMQLSTMQRWLRGDAPFTKRQFRRAFDRTTEFYFIAY